LGDIYNSSLKIQEVNVFLMAIYKLRDEKIVKLNTTTFAKEKINEATDLQKFIVNSIEVIDPNLFVISTEFCVRHCIDDKGYY
jgi:hypothetical protein